MLRNLCRAAAFAVSFVFVASLALAQVSVTQVTPNSSTTGLDVTIDGTGFDTAKPSVSLTTSGSSKKYTLKVKTFSSTQIVATVGTVVAGTFDVNVKVKTNIGSLASGLTIATPSFTNMSPTTAAPKDTVTITGDFFGTKKGKILVNGKSAKVLTWSNTQITFEMPKLASGSYAVVIDNKIGQAQAGSITSNVPPAPISGADRLEVTANGAKIKTTGVFLNGTHSTATHLNIIVGANPGAQGKNVQMSFVYDLTNGTVPTTYNTGQGSVLIQFTDVNGGNASTWLSALGGTYKVTITGRTANSIEGTFEASNMPKGQGPGAATMNLVGGVFKTKLQVQ